MLAFGHLKVVKSASDSSVPSQQSRRDVASSSSALTASASAAKEPQQPRSSSAKPAALARRVEIDARTIEVYNMLVRQVDAAATTPKQSRDDAALDTLCERLSSLEEREARTVLDLMRHHRALNSSKTKLAHGMSYPYEDMREREEDLHVSLDKLPEKLVAILAQYVSNILDGDE
jgi:hypothetical protein